MRGSGGSVWSTIVVVDVPDSDGVGALLFGGPGAGVEELFGEDSVVALDLSVVAWGVRGEALVAGPGEYLREIGRSVAGTVVGDEAHDAVDAVRGEEGASSVDESDYGERFFIG